MEIKTKAIRKDDLQQVKKTQYHLI